MQDTQTGIMEIPREKIDIALEINTSASLFAGMDGKIVSVNNHALKLFGYGRTELVGQEMEILLPERYRAKHVHYRVKYMENPIPRRMGGTQELWALKQDGTEFPVEIGLSPFISPDGPVVMASIVDVSDRHQLQKMVKRQQEDLMELSTPVIELWSGILVLPVVGTLDSERSRCMMEQLLHELSETGCGVAIIDISGVPTVDTLVAQHLMKTIDAARLMGAECIISGIRPEIANTIVHLGIDLSKVKTKGSMAKALADAFDLIGLTVVSKSSLENARKGWVPHARQQPGNHFEAEGYGDRSTAWRHR